jgi:hypothetical protein
MYRRCTRRTRSVRGVQQLCERLQPPCVAHNSCAAATAWVHHLQPRWASRQLYCVYWRVSTDSLKNTPQVDDVFNLRYNLALPDRDARLRHTPGP